MTKDNVLPTRGTAQFNDYLAKYKDQAKNEKSNNFYHVDVVAEAYNQGFSDGEQKGRKEFIDDLVKSTTERFTQQANQVYILTNVAVSHLQKHGYSVNAFFINIAHPNPKVLIAVDGDLLLDDGFVELSYSKLFELKKIFSKLFECTLDIGLISYDNLDMDALKEDRFDYSEFIGASNE